MLALLSMPATRSLYLTSTVDMALEQEQPVAKRFRIRFSITCIENSIAGSSLPRLRKASEHGGSPCIFETAVACPWCLLPLLRMMARPVKEKLPIMNKCARDYSEEARAIAMQHSKA